MSTPAPAASSPEQVGPFQVSILIFSLVALGAIVADAFFSPPREVSRILQGVDLIACLVFLVDFVIRFRLAKSKAAFMKWGWIDLLASIPNVDVLRFGRFLRVFRIIRLLREMRSLPRVLSVIYSHRAQGGLATVGVAMFLLVTTASIGVLVFETSGPANIKTAGDAVWWSFTTVTTVGYGDRYPVTPEGRVIAVGLMIAGVGLFGALSGVVASLLLGQRGQESEMLAEIRALRARVEKLAQERAPGTEQRR